MWLPADNSELLHGLATVTRDGYVIVVVRQQDEHQWTVTWKARMCLELITVSRSISWTLGADRMGRIVRSYV